MAHWVPQVLEEGTLRDLVKGPLRLQVEETIQVRVEGKLRVGVEEKLRQQAGWEQEAMWDRPEPRCLK